MRGPEGGFNPAGSGGIPLRLVRLVRERATRTAGGRHSLAIAYPEDVGVSACMRFTPSYRAGWRKALSALGRSNAACAVVT
jgi:hypothetical protein